MYKKQNANKVDGTGKVPVIITPPPTLLKPVIISTNINCAEGEEKVLPLLKKLTGVLDATVNTKTGWLAVTYNQNDKALNDAIINVINEAGFDAGKIKSKKVENNPCTAKPPANNPANNITTIQTNINCEEGKILIEKILKSEKGVKSAVVDIRNGILKLDYSSDRIPYTEIISIINEVGFDADKIKSNKVENNPCAVKTENNVITIQTNINCEEGKQNVESILKDQRGILSVKTNFKTGKLIIEYIKEEITYAEIITFINRAGFDTDGKKTTDPDNNPCIKKPEPITTSTIKGRLFYRYKRENELPNSKPFTFPAATKIKKVQLPNGTPSGFSVHNDEPYPEFIANGMFDKDNESRPLKNVKINLVYAFFTSSDKTPTQYSDLKSYDRENESYNALTTHANDFPVENRPDEVLGKGITDSNGNFSISFLNNRKIGLIEEYANSNDYGAVRIAIDEDKFSNSDVIIFPQKGKTITLPDEVVLTLSHNLEITVKTDPTIIDQAITSGKTVDNYPLQLSVLRDFYPTNSGYPIEANIEAYKNLHPVIEGMSARVLDIGKTNEYGKYVFKKILANDFYYPKEGDFKYVQALETKLEGNYAYETQTIEIKGDLCNKCPVPFANYKLSKRNSVNKIITIKREILIKPKKPEIYLRAITNQGGHTKGISNVTVTITEFTNENFFTPTVNYYKTDENGYLHLTDLEIKTQKQGDKTKVIGPYRTIKLTKPGFADLMVTGEVAQLLPFGERFPASVDQLMKGAGNIVGQVVNEKGEPVVCNVRVGVGPYVKTETNGWYQIDNCQTGFTSIEIVPAVDNYFPETILQVIKEGNNTVTNIKGNKESKVVVIEKLHRVQFKIVDENNKIITESCTRVGADFNTCYATDPYTGLSNKIAIASPDLEFHARTEAPGYVTYDNYVEIPLSKTPKVVTIKLIKGQIITGVVKDAKTLQAIKGARVYSVSGTNEDGEIQNETYTDDNGKYTLTGVINQGTWMENLDAYLQLPVKVYAVKSGTPAYIRQMQSVQGHNGKGEANFDLDIFNARAEIWGLPIEVTTATTNGNKINLTGSFVKLPDNSTFKPSSYNATLPFKNIEVALEKAGAFGSSSENKINPVKNSIDLEATAFKVTAFNKYACEVIGTPEEGKLEKLTVTNKQGCGIINGFITSQLSSFNFSYNYTGKFLLDQTGKKPFSIISEPSAVLGATNCLVPVNNLTLSALYNKSSFSVHNFSAKLGSGSYVDKEGFFINADVNLQIPLVGVKTMPAGQIKIVQNDITWSDYKGIINLPLESWTVKGNGLLYDINQGGFRVIDGSLQTNLPQVPLKNLIINPTSLDLGENTLTGNELLTLANVTPLNITPGAKLTLDYDAAAPFDQKPHYRINLTSKNKTVAYINDLPGMDKDDKVKIEILSAYSDGEHKTVLVNPEKHTYYNVVSQNVSGIQVLENSFTLIGNTDLGILGANSNVTGRFQFYKDAADKDKDANGVVCKVQKMQTDVQMEGKVKFNGTTFLLSQNNLTVKGDVIMYKESVDDAIKGIHGTLTKTTPRGGIAYTKKPEGVKIKMDIDPNEKIVMGGVGNKSMTIQSGGNEVVVNKWSLVKFTAKPEGYKTNGKEILTEKGNLIDFVVNGAIESDKDSKKVIVIDGVETPFGDLTISLDFEQKILVGSLTLEDANIPLGPVRIMDGTIDMQIDNMGFILVGAITEAKFTIPVPLISDFKSGIAIGFYDGPLPQYMTNKLLDVTLYKKLPGLEKGLKGFYVNVMKSLTKDDLKKSIPGPNLHIPGADSFLPDIEFFAGIDIRTSIDLAGTKMVTIGGMAEANASISVTVAGCTLGMSAGAGTNFNLTYANEAFTGAIEFKINGGIEYCVGKKDIRVSLILEKTPKDFNIDASFK